MITKMNIYYKLWVDAICHQRKRDEDWKFRTLMTFSIAMGVNLLSLMFLLKVFFDCSMIIEIDLFEGTVLDRVLSGFGTLFLPFIILNYFLIFYHKRYEVLLKEYEPANGRLYVSYLIISFAILIGPIVVGKYLL